MLRYYIDYPRDFANEYSVHAVKAGDAGRFEGLFPNAERITRARAINRGWVRPRQARKDGEQWYGGFQTYYGDAMNVEEAITQCVEATEYAMNDLEAMRTFSGTMTGGNS